MIWPNYVQTKSSIGFKNTTNNCIVGLIQLQSFASVEVDSQQPNQHEPQHPKAGIAKPLVHVSTKRRGDGPYDRVSGHAKPQGSASGVLGD